MSMPAPWRWPGAANDPRQPTPGLPPRTCRRAVVSLAPPAARLSHPGAALSGAVGRDRPDCPTRPRAGGDRGQGPAESGHGQRVDLAAPAPAGRPRARAFPGAAPGAGASGAALRCDAGDAWATATPPRRRLARRYALDGAI